MIPIYSNPSFVTPRVEALFITQMAKTAEIESKLARERNGGQGGTTPSAATQARREQDLRFRQSTIISTIGKRRLSVKQIAELTGFSKASVANQVYRLEATGVLERQTVAMGNARVPVYKVVNGHEVPADDAVTKKRKEIYALHKAGKSVREISMMTGMTAATVRSDIDTVRRMFEGGTDRALILDHIADNPGCTSKQINEATGLGVGPISSHLLKMTEQGLLKRTGKRPMKYFKEDQS